MKIVHWTIYYFMLVNFHVIHSNFIDSIRFLDSNEVNENSDCLLSPVILIPGFGGSKMEAKLNKPTAPHWWCSKKSDYFNIWLDYHPVLSFDCWMDNLKLVYDPETRKTKNTPGVVTRVIGWGSTESMEWIWIFGAYFNYISEALVNRGYIRGKNLFGAPYDFRKGPNESTQWFQNLKQLTEYSYGINKNTRVTFIAYSMGGRMLLHFLQQMPQDWKDKYLERTITLAVPWGGSVRPIQAVSVGYDLGIAVFPNDKLKEMSNTFPSLAYLMPSKQFWEPDEALVIMDSKSYSLENIDEFFYDIGQPQMAEIRKDQSVYNNFTAPGVEIHCLFGANIPTAERLYFKSGFNSKPVILDGDGDGQVNRRSLWGCRHWENTPAQAGHAVYFKEFKDVNHLKILYNSESINYILKIVTCDAN
ncbi:phospholipase A2 group XV-like [Sitodiplosis mosellana]|uniref:phospholipase A2 group XV-like n=1 Tax=Sitodiplosis mosellana TaxID=263140 RepID=UPI002443AC7A|nr:phospholipase A2 group XV-like [Sitodiplosis mosellana]